MVFEKIASEEYEQIVFCHDHRVGLKAIISIHSTVLGPAVGGLRMWAYESENEALTDVLRLSKGMTYKASLAGLNWGGGKAVLIGDAKKDKNPAMLIRFGEYVDRMGGTYVTAKDVGIGAEDLRQIKKGTHHILGIAGEANSSGDPSPATAWGTYHGMKACAKAAFGTDSLKGLKIAMQGLGSVSFPLVEHVLAEGATVIGCDISSDRVRQAQEKFRIETVDVDQIYDVPCDVFSPNALGAVISRDTIPRIKAKVIAGAANNQLAADEDGEVLAKKGVIYAPDYAINAGGLINIYHEAAVEGGYNKDRAFSHTAKIYDTITNVIARAKAERKSTSFIADRMAEERVERARQAKPARAG